MLSVSLAAVPVRPRQFSSHHVITTALVEIKHCAKNQPGNSLFVDRRMQSASFSDEQTTLDPPCRRR